MGEIAVMKTENVGNTFLGLAVAAFGAKAHIRIPHHLQHASCGTIEVDGVGYDWRVRGDEVVFVEAK